jgi:uncharacterized protein (TIGR03437 family)
VRFYKSSQNTGTHTGSLWTRSGSRLATVTFTNESASGWQQANFASPVAITANTTYVISYRAPRGQYSVDDRYFTTSAVTNGPLQALKDGADGVNGVYRYGNTAFPTKGYVGSNYWVDVVFSPTATATTTVTTLSNKLGIKAAGQKRATQQAGPSSLSCSPKTVQSGSSFTCEVQLNDASVPMEIAIDGSSSNLLLPATVTSRANQHSVTFQGSVNEGAAQESFTVSATVGQQTVEDSMVAIPGSGPAISVPGDQFVPFGKAVNFKVTASAGEPAAVKAADLPAGASFDPATGRFEWTPLESQQGSYDVKFTSASENKTVHIEVGRGTPVVSESSQLACSPGAVANIKGMWLSDGEAADPSGASAELSGARVKVNGVYAPVVYASQTLVQFLCPNEAAGTALETVLETSSGAAPAIRTDMQAVSPVVLSADSSAQGLIVLPERAKIAAVRDVNGGEPAQPADSLLIRATGLGNDLPVAVKIGAAYAEVGSITPVDGAAGVWHIRANVPAGVTFGDAVPVRLEVQSNGQTVESNTVTMALEPVRP